MFMRYSIGFGVGFDRNGKRIDPVQVREATKLILVEATRRFGGCNITTGQGAWMNDKGDLVVEESRELTVDGDKSKEDDAFALAEFVRRVLDQEAVHLARLDGIAVNLVASPARGELVAV
jgi:hypothetical protein